MKLTFKTSLSVALLFGMAISGLCRPSAGWANGMPEYLLTPLGAERPTSLDDGWDCLNELFDGRTCRICMMDTDPKSAREQIQSTVEMWEENYYGKDPQSGQVPDMIKLSAVSNAGSEKVCVIATGTELPTAAAKN